MGTPRTNRDWQAWGRLDPMYGVATIPGRAKTDPDSWDAGAFVEFGASDWRLFRRHWEQYGLSRESCLEIGCGAGRMTAQLAQEFGAVDAVDVSRDMVALARHHVGSEAATFHVTDGVHLPLPDDAVAAVFSTHVFQHLESVSVADAVLGEVHRVMRPGATLMIHLPIAVWPQGRAERMHEQLDRLLVWSARKAVAAKRLAHRWGLRRYPPMAVLSYESSRLQRTLDRLGFEDVEIRIVFSDSAMALVHPLLLARKRAAPAADG